MKKTLVSALTTALVVGAASTTFAAANPFSDVPADSWAYDAVAQLAQDGVITYNGVTFVCDERTNSICLGDMSDKSKVLNIALSGGGCLKVNRDNIGDLSACVGMFSPEDLNLIMRAIAQDTKAQEMLLEKEDMEGVPLRNRPVDAE